MEIYKEIIEQFDKALSNAFSYTDEFQEKIIESMKYSLYSGGKRVRPLFCMLTYLELSETKDLEEIMPYAVAIELIHTYSLIHDDLPCMDNDDIRRGKPTNHKVYSDTIATLAGDALLNMSMEILVKNIDRLEDFDSIKKATKAIKYIYNASGVNGMIGGQVIDIDYPKNALTKEITENMYKLKTGALIRASAVVGAIIAGANEDDISKISEFSENIGLAYQYKDDLIDRENDTKKDEINILNYYDEEAIKKKIQSLTDKGYEAIRDLRKEKNYLRDFAVKLLNRSY